MKKIDKAWEMNLGYEKYDQYESKEELIEDGCPSEYGLKDISNVCGDNCTKCWNEEIEEIKDKETVTASDLSQYEGKLNCGFYPCKYGLNVTIEDDLGFPYPYQEITNEDVFNTLRQSPISGICLNNTDVEQLKKYLKTNHEDGIIYFKQFNVNKDEEVSLQYDDIPKLIKWLEDVYDLTTNLKVEIEKEEKYTNFYLAREHMHKGGKCEYEGKIYYINNGVMRLEFDFLEDKVVDRVAYLSLEDIDSLEWLILDK